MSNNNQQTVECAPRVHLTEAITSFQDGSVILVRVGEAMRAAEQANRPRNGWRGIQMMLSRRITNLRREHDALGQQIALTEARTLDFTRSAQRLVESMQSFGIDVALGKDATLEAVNS